MHPHLLEANISCILPETSSANVQSIFADESMGVIAHAARTEKYFELTQI